MMIMKKLLDLPCLHVIFLPAFLFLFSVSWSWGDQFHVLVDSQVDQILVQIFDITTPGAIF